MKNFITRRALLRAGASAFAIIGAGSRLSRFGRLNAAVNPTTPNYKAMVCVFLFGGNDAGNMLIPISTVKNKYSDYYGIRGTALGLAQNTLPTITTPASEIYGLHPQLAPLQGLFQQNRLAFVAALLSRAPESTDGWLAMTPTDRPRMRAKPTTMLRA